MASETLQHISGLKPYETAAFGCEEKYLSIFYYSSLSQSEQTGFSYSFATLLLVFINAGIIQSYFHVSLFNLHFSFKRMYMIGDLLNGSEKNSVNLLTSETSLSQTDKKLREKSTWKLF